MEQITRTPEQLVAVLRRFRQEKRLVAGSAWKTNTHAAGDYLGDRKLGYRYAAGYVARHPAALDLELVVRPRSKGTAQEIEEAF